MTRDWKENYVDFMGLIVAQSGEERFKNLKLLKLAMDLLTDEDKAAVKETLRQRFTPSNGQDGCEEAMDSMRTINGG